MKSVKTEYEQLFRLMVTGTTVGPNIYQIMEILGRDEVLRRIKQSLPPSSNGQENGFSIR